MSTDNRDGIAADDTERIYRDRDADVVRDRDGDGVPDAQEARRARDIDSVTETREASLRDVVVGRERERFGGIKFGSAFFGWLTALGALVALTAVVAAIGAATGLTSPQAVDDAAEAATSNIGGATVIGAIAIAVVLFIAYFAGGYVAGRMARFSGAKQGFAVWLWAILIAIVVAVITLIAGGRWDILANVDIFPRIPVTADTATLTGILTAIGAAVITLVAAVLGGMAGMSYHRRVDRVGLDGVDRVDRVRS
ncbi:YrzE family protein [Microbacterium sp. NPDC058062]|uniref:YrzE family protein n=1 Tax=Microbacterium sp. NPDC058062 TaxID=3346320 RepID=UPI0036D864E1